MKRRSVIILTGAVALAPATSAQMAERVYRIGFLSTAYANAFASRVEAMKGGFRDLGYVEGRNISFEYRFADLNSERLPGLAADLVQSNVDVIITAGTPPTIAAKHDTLMATYSRLIADLSLRHRMLSIGITEFAEAGGTMAWGINRPALFRRTAYFADKLLRGAKPGDLPVELRTKFELIVNARTAATLGVKIPNTVLIRVDRLVE